jgi:hypothetical protein
MMRAKARRATVTANALVHPSRGHLNMATSHERRDVLPIPDRTESRASVYDAKDPGATFPPIEPLRPPQGAPNVLIVLIDDTGFGAATRPPRTPTI